MRLSRNRKASSAYPALIALAGMLALASCWFILLDKSHSFDGTIGENQFMLLQQYQEGENYLFYLDQAADYSTEESIRRLAYRGGFLGDSGCGEIAGYQIWVSSGKECYPTDATLLSSFETQFSISMNDYSHISYLPLSNITLYTFDYTSQKPLTFIARPVRYTDFVTKIMTKGAELPPGATSKDLEDNRIRVHYIELGDPIDYEELSSVGVN